MRVVGLMPSDFAAHWTSKRVSDELEGAYLHLTSSKYWTYDFASKPILGPPQQRTILNGLLFPVCIKTDCAYNVHGSGTKLSQELVSSHFPVKAGSKKQVSSPKNLQKDNERTLL
jgi:hypothetical protein